MQLCPISWQRVKKHPRAQGTSVHVWSWQLKYTTPGSPLLSWFYRVKTMKIRTGPDHLAENQMHVGERALHTHTHTCTGAHNQRDGRGVHSSSVRAIDTWKQTWGCYFGPGLQQVFNFLTSSTLMRRSAARREITVKGDQNPRMFERWHRQQGRSLNVKAVHVRKSRTVGKQRNEGRALIHLPKAPLPQSCGLPNV